jgi:hypothetical protein
MAAGRRGNRHDRGLPPVHRAPGRVDDHGDGGQHGRQQVLHAVHRRQAFHAEEGQMGEQKDAEAAVEVAAVDRHGEQAAQQGRRPARTHAPQAAGELRADGEEHGRGQEQPGHEAPECRVGGQEQQRGPEKAARQAGRHQPARPQARDGLDVAAQPVGPARVSGQKRDGAGGIRRDRRQAGMDQRGKGEEAAAACHGVQRTGQEGRDEKQSGCPSDFGHAIRTPGRAGHGRPAERSGRPRRGAGITVGRRNPEPQARRASPSRSDDGRRCPRLLPTAPCMSTDRRRARRRGSPCGRAWPAPWS